MNMKTQGFPSIIRSNRAGKASGLERNSAVTVYMTYMHLAASKMAGIQHSQSIPKSIFSGCFWYSSMAGWKCLMFNTEYIFKYSMLALAKLDSGT